MEYLIRFVQMHESFRKPETEALAELFGLDVEWVFYSEHSPFAILRFPNHPDPSAAASLLISRSILSSAIYELWGTTHNNLSSAACSNDAGLYASLHEDVHARSQHLWPKYKESSFRFTLDSFRGSHSTAEQRQIIETFSYTNFEGPIRMNNAEEHFVIFEDYLLNAPAPHTLHLGRLLATSGRKAINTYNLKKRRYIATTSMDAELSLVTANLALAREGTLAYDPFMGTGGFPLACAHFGAGVWGSDLDGRSIRGKGKNKSVKGNFVQYGTECKYLGGFVADLTNTPLRIPSPSAFTSMTDGKGFGEEGGKGVRFLDAILTDPPYGVREGLKVLGSTKPALQSEVLLADGQPAHLAETYVPPKRPYSFTRMLDDILDFAANTLVDGGSLCMWMPVAGAVAEDEEGEEGKGKEEGDVEEGEAKEYAIPSHPSLELVSECTQHFNKWSRRLLTYRRLRDGEVDEQGFREYRRARAEMVELGKGTADSMNDFRRKYFQGFKDPALPGKFEKLPHAY